MTQTMVALPPKPEGAKAERVADVLGISFGELRKRAPESSLSNPGEWLNAETVDGLLSGMKPRRPAVELLQLIGKSFVAAKASGKSDWHIMTLSVFKNRLIAASANGFDEADFGFPSLPYLVAAHPGVLLLVDSGSPFKRVELLQLNLVNEAVPVPVRDGNQRVRDDLWRAVMDYSSGRTYCWDVTTAKAIAATGLAADGPTFPTISRHTMLQWRAEFSGALRVALSVDETAAVEHWSREGLRSLALPRVAREEWNSFQTEKVAAVAAAFFSENSIAEPTDILTVRRSHSTQSKQRSESTVLPRSTLRAFLHACIDTMTDEELSGLSLSPVVLLRLKGKL